jgi:hypothetical protein
MNLGTLNASWLRSNFLLGVNLGVAWNGVVGDGAMHTLLTLITNDVESVLLVQFARKRILTDPDPALVLGTDYDLVGERLHYFQPSPTMPSYYIPLPQAHVVSIERVRLFLRNQLVYTIPDVWISFTSKEGLLRIAPFLSNAVPQSTTAGWVPGLFPHDTLQTIAAAWSVDYTIGYGQVDADIARYIGLRAAIQVLGLAGAGADIAAGLSSESLTQDGITESISHAQGKYGLYSGLVQLYMDELDRIDLKGKRLAKRGVKIAVW